MAGLLLFGDKGSLSFDDIGQYLSSANEVSSSERAFSWLTDWLAQNKSRFRKNEQDTWGEVNEGTEIYSVKIIRSVFDKACQEAGYNPQSFLSWLKRKDIIETDGRGLSKRTRINGVLCQCVVLRLSPDGFVEITEEESSQLSDLSDMPL